MKTHILKLYITICYFLVATVSYAINCEGNGTADSPYIIKSADNLKELSTDVRNGNSYKGTYFVLGDNRKSTDDSRLWGVITSKDIDAKALFCYLPFKNFKIY